MSANRNPIENNKDFTGATGTRAGRGAAGHLLIPVNVLGGAAAEFVPHPRQAELTASPLRKRYELAGRHHPSNGMWPARQDLKTGRNSASHPHQRLEIRDYFTAVDSLPELNFCFSLTYGHSRNP
jgi:hypothetical protein